MKAMIDSPIPISSNPVLDVYVETPTSANEMLDG
jgi:hypothetical protein